MVSRTPAEMSVEMAEWSFPARCFPQVLTISESPDVIDGSAVGHILGLLPSVECAHSLAAGIIPAIGACHQCSPAQATSFDLALRGFQIPCPIVVSELTAPAIAKAEGSAGTAVGAATPDQPQSSHGDGFFPRHACSHIEPCSNNPSALSL